MYLHLHLVIPLKCCHPFLALDIVCRCHFPRGLKGIIVNMNLMMKSGFFFTLNIRLNLHYLGYHCHHLPGLAKHYHHYPAEV